jgi:ribosomal protein S1
VIAMSQAQEPQAWQRFVQAHAEGEVVTGQVVSVVPFGAFVELGAGVHGLVHVSEWVEPIEDGSTVHVRIIALDQDNRRVSLKPA